MGGKSQDAKAIGQWLGTGGSVTSGDGSVITPPWYYFTSEAAETLGMSFIELLEHPHRMELQSIGLTLSRGRNLGISIAKDIEAKRAASKQTQGNSGRRG